MCYRASDIYVHSIANDTNTFVLEERAQLIDK